LPVPHQIFVDVSMPMSSSNAVSIKTIVPLSIAESVVLSGGGESICAAILRTNEGHSSMIRDVLIEGVKRAVSKEIGNLLQPVLDELWHFVATVFGPDWLAIEHYAAWLLALICGGWHHMMAAISAFIDRWWN
jgi:hypothetical protein